MSPRIAVDFHINGLLGFDDDVPCLAYNQAEFHTLKNKLMASSIRIGQNWVFYSNSSHRSMLDFMIDVGDRMSHGDEKNWVEILREEQEHFFPGLDLNLTKLFPLKSQAEFWIRCLDQLRSEIINAKIGNTDDQSWHPGFLKNLDEVRKHLSEHHLESEEVLNE